MRLSSVTCNPNFITSYFMRNTNTLLFNYLFTTHQ